MASDLHHRDRTKTLGWAGWGSRRGRGRHSLRSFEFLEGRARGVNLLHVLFGVLGEYAEQIQQRDGPALAVLAGAREGFFRQIL